VEALVSLLSSSAVWWDLVVRTKSMLSLDASRNYLLVVRAVHGVQNNKSLSGGSCSVAQLLSCSVAQSHEMPCSRCREIV
jgi:hypothetical protein